MPKASRTLALIRNITAKAGTPAKAGTQNQRRD
jgi:hypothetical protein